MTKFRIIGALLIVGALAYWGGYHEATARYQALASEFSPLQEQS